MKQFTDLGLAKKILRAVSDEGYTTPTPIQAQVIPAMLKGRDVVGIAQTGTGKTAAFVLPLLDAIAQKSARPEPKRCGALILAPTRELAAQIAESIKTYGRYVYPTSTVIVGGAKPGPQRKALVRGLDVIIATPGRLEDHMSQGTLRLDHTTTIILDEADQMMDLGFMPAIRRIMAKLPRKRQTLLLSATMPKQIRSLANDFLNNPEEISVAPQSRPIERINQKIYLLPKADKRRKLVEILEDSTVNRAIVFTRTKHGADKVKLHLQKAGLDASAIHGNKSQRQREQTLAAFRGGRVNILVATDIAARGIDVDNISHVVNFELPNVPEAYVHRIGRTARAGKSGIAISLCDSTERAYLRDIEKLIGSPLDKENLGGSEAGHAHESESRPSQPRGRRGAPKKGQARFKKKPGNRNRPSGGNKSTGDDSPTNGSKPPRRHKPKTAKSGQGSQGQGQGRPGGNRSRQRSKPRAA